MSSKYGPWPSEKTKLWGIKSKQTLEESRNIIDSSPYEIGDPNHPIHSGLFGYETKELLDKQYKER